MTRQAISPVTPVAAPGPTARNTIEGSGMGIASAGNAIEDASKS